MSQLVSEIKGARFIFLTPYQIWVVKFKQYSYEKVKN
jgi:hypothetical protein